MSLRTRIFLLFSTILVLLLGAQWWFVDGLRQELRRETAAIAHEVGVAVVQDNDWLAWADARRRSDAAMAQSAATQAAAQAAAEAGGRQAPPLPAIPVVPGTKIPEATARLDAMTRDFQVDVLLGSLAVLLLGLGATAALARAVTRPLRGLAAAAAAIGDGRFDTRVGATGDPGFDATIAAFNAMSARLQQLEAEARAHQDRGHLAELGEVARGLAHSLRNPLHALGLVLAELADPAADARRRGELAATCREQIARIDGSLRTFLSLSASRGEPAQPVDVAEVVQDVVMEAAQSAGGRVQIACDLGPRPMLRGVGAELRTALHVLVCNAVEASGGAGEVAVTVAGHDGAVEVAVEDHGPGLPAQVRARLFEPHVTTKEQGAGLGLFLAERIARRRYGGSLVLADRTPRGLRAVLTLRDAVATAHG